MDAACTIQDSIHVFSLVRKYVSRILGTYHNGLESFAFLYFPGLAHHRKMIECLGTEILACF